jgi:hypothetical protein
MKRQLLLVGAGLISALTTIAQNDIDAMRYSQLTFGGTARFASMAGSMGALGGDISTLSFNPAGIAVYKKSELSITPSLFTEKTTSVYNDETSSDRKLNLNLGNIGLVATKNLAEKNNSTGWQSINFGFGYNRTNNFNTRVSIQGSNKTSSLLDDFVHSANGHASADLDGFSTGLAYQAYLLNPINPGNLPNFDTNYYDHVIPHYGELQKKSMTTKGSMGETVISFGGNYKNKVLIGATMGIVNARYTEETVYEEIDEKDTIKNFKSFAYSQNLTSKGTGFNVKFGVIVKPIDWLRIGAAIHSPTVIGMKDTYNSKMSSDLDNGDVHTDLKSKDGSFDYTVTTPFRAIGSLGFVVLKNALLNVDYEYVDYSYAQLSSSPNVFSDVNKTIRSNYTSTSNLRVGGEVRLDPITIRGGYALYGSPFLGGENKNASRSSYTAGLGFRENNYFIDFAYVFTKYTQYNYLYDPALVSSVKNNYQNSSFMFTFGVKF